MLVLLSLIGLAAITLVCISLLKTYYHLPPKELKRRARGGDPLAKGLYRAAAYGLSLKLLLWGLIGVASALFFVLLNRSVAAAWQAFIWSVVLIGAGFAWLPHGRVTRLSVRLANWLAPFVSLVLQYVHPLLDRLGSFIRKYRPVRIHTGLYQKDDLVELISRQQVQADNRIAAQELQIALHALTFGDKSVRDYLTPRRIVKMVSAADTVGPILMGELHGSGHSRFPVFQDKPENIVGTLYLRDMIEASTGGRVADIMSRRVYYVHEDRPLHDALQAFLKTKHHLFIVVNSFEEYVGIITIEDVLEQIIGRPIVDEFDQYDSLRAVAQRQAAAEHAGHGNKVVE